MRRYTVAIDDRAFTIDVQETSSDTFEVTVDGLTFEATLRGDHDLPGSDISPEIPMIETARPKGPPEKLPEAAREARPAAPRTTAAGGAPPPAGAAGRERIDVMTAPMPGVVLEVHVAAGAEARRPRPRPRGDEDAQHDPLAARRGRRRDRRRGRSTGRFGRAARPAR
jgi:biotin carboxyl carrier protein